MALTDLSVRTAKAGPTLQKLSDGRGLQLHITPTDSKLWRWAHRHAGKQKLMALGIYGAKQFELRVREAKQGSGPRSASHLHLRDGRRGRCDMSGVENQSRRDVVTKRSVLAFDSSSSQRVNCSTASFSASAARLPR